MDERDAAAARRGFLRVLAILWATWLIWLCLPALLIGGVTRGDAVFLAGSALAFAVLSHVIRLSSARRTTARTGPLAGLGPADVEEVVFAVRKGRAVADPRLAGPAVDFARRRLRLRSVRFLLPVLVVLRVVNVVADLPVDRGRLAWEAVVIGALLVLWITSLVGDRRADASERANASLQATVKRPASAARDN